MNFSTFYVNRWFTPPDVIHDSFSYFAQRLINLPFFEPDDANALSTENLDVSQVFDLNGKGAVEALALVEAALHEQRRDEEAHGEADAAQAPDPYQLAHRERKRRPRQARGAEREEGDADWLADGKGDGRSEGCKEGSGDDS